MIEIDHETKTIRLQFAYEGQILTLPEGDWGGYRIVIVDPESEGPKNRGTIMVKFI